MGALTTLATIALVGGLVWFTRRDARAATVGETDLNEVVATFEAAWRSSDTATLRSMFHPDKAASELRALESARARRSWGQALVPLVSTRLDYGQPLEESGEGPPVAPPPGEAPAWKTGWSAHETEEGLVVCGWQYSARLETWILYSLDLPSPPLEQRLTRFEAAWNQGDRAGVERLLHVPKRQDILRTLTRVAENRQWGEPFLAIEREGLEPDLTALADPWTEGRYPDELEARYATDRGPMVFRWVLDRGSDAWFVRAIAPPKD